MNMLQLNDLLHPSEWEPYWTIYGNDHEGLIKGAEYVIFEYYCTEAKCNCENIKVEIKQLGNDGEPIEESLAILNYNLSPQNKCHPDFFFFWCVGAPQDADPLKTALVTVLRVQVC